jgi:hypothetical protein
MTHGPNPLQLQDCPACQAQRERYHACAFLTGRFDAHNWRCGTLRDLALRAAVVEGDEVDTLLVERPDGAVVTLVRRTGQPQRVRLAWLVTPQMDVRPLTAADLESVLPYTV